MFLSINCSLDEHLRLQSRIFIYDRPKVFNVISLGPASEYISLGPASEYISLGPASEYIWFCCLLLWAVGLRYQTIHGAILLNETVPGSSLHNIFFYPVGEFKLAVGNA